MQEQMEQAVLKTLAFQACWSHAPTRLQLFLLLDFPEGPELEKEEAFRLYNQAIEKLLGQNKIVQEQGLLALANFSSIIASNKNNEIYFPRKIKKIRQVAKYLSRLPWVRAVILCNTTALGHADDKSDLDFFVICKAGSIWRARFFSALPFKLLNARPGEAKIDPVCLSFFVTDSSLNLSELALSQSDPYLRYWFFNLMPFYDDGILAELWDQNHALRRNHPFAQRWVAFDKTPVLGSKPAEAAPPNPSIIEQWLRQFQMVRFPKPIADIANQDTRVVINDNVLKFHVTDNRKRFRDDYYKICHELNINP